MRQGKLTASITTLSVANIFYIGRRLAGLEKAEHSVHACLELFEILPVDRRSLESALQLSGSDFEDKIQVAASIEAQLDGIVTRDPRGFLSSPIAIYTPEDLLNKITA